MMEFEKQFAPEKEEYATPLAKIEIFDSRRDVMDDVIISETDPFNKIFGGLDLNW